MTQFKVLEYDAVSTLVSLLQVQNIYCRKDLFPAMELIIAVHICQSTKQSPCGSIISISSHSISHLPSSRPVVL